MKVLGRLPNPSQERPAGNRPLLAATAVAGGCLVAVGLVGTLSMRHFGRVPFSVPSWPWYHSWPSYLFWQPHLDRQAALVALPVALAAAATLATVAAGCLGLLVVAGLARDELGDHGERVAVVCWALAPVTVLYLATSADAMWAPVLAGAALAADRGLQRRSLGWTVVLGLAGLLWAATGYDVVAAVAAVDDFWRHAPGTGQRVWWVWIFGDLVAFAAILGFPLAAALAVRLVAVVRERAWGSFEAATGAALLAAACWDHTRGEVERMWQFLVPFAVVVAARQLLRWRAGLPLVAGLLLGQALAIQVLFYTRW